MNESTLRSACRSVAFVIALLAVVDPAITSSRTTKPEVVVLASNVASDSALARQVSERLARSFTVLTSPFSGAAATVIVGATVPAHFRSVAGPVFAVSPAATNELTLEALRVPASSATDARVPVSAVVRASGADGKQVDLSLLVDNSVVDRATRTVSGADARVEVPLSFVPTAAGTVLLTVVAQVKGASASVSVDATVSVRDQKWAVLFFDARPSWMSTFVRRAVERDTRFAVTSRVVTSTNVSTDAGRPPGTLDDPAVTELYDAVIVGAPEALSERDVEGLQKFLRRRGGSVVLLFDGNRRGRYEQLADVAPFANTSNSLPTVIAGATTDSVAMRATEWMWPLQLPTGATVLAWSDAHASSARHPMVWTTPAGAGRVVVSGALDAWKFRDGAQSGFEAFWQQTIAAAASASAAAVDVRVPTTAVLPGAEVEIVVTSRVAALTEVRDGGSVRSTVAAHVALPSGRAFIRVWPTGTPGEFRGSFGAPIGPGIYELTAVADGARASAPVVVSPVASAATPFMAGLLAAWVGANGGAVVPATELAELPRALQRALSPAERRVVWHPMRSAWWLVPFVLAVSAEWWLRRRRGLP